MSDGESQHRRLMETGRHPVMSLVLLAALLASLTTLGACDQVTLLDDFQHAGVRRLTSITPLLETESAHGINGLAVYHDAAAASDYALVLIDGSVYRVDLDSDTAHKVTTTYPCRDSLAIHQATLLALCATNDGVQLFALSGAPGGPDVLIADQDNVAPTWSPDGRLMAVAGGPAGKCGISIYAVSLTPGAASAKLVATLGFQQRFHGTICPRYGLSWSPDERWLSFQNGDIQGAVPGASFTLVAAPSVAQLEANARLGRAPQHIEETTVETNDRFGVESPNGWASAPGQMVAVTEDTTGAPEKADMNLVLVDTRNGQQRTLLVGIPPSDGSICSLALTDTGTQIVFNLCFVDSPQAKLYVYTLPAPITSEGG